MIKSVEKKIKRLTSQTIGEVRNEFLIYLVKQGIAAGRVKTIDETVKLPLALLYSKHALATHYRNCSVCYEGLVSFSAKLTTKLQFLWQNLCFHCSENTAPNVIFMTNLKSGYIKLVLHKQSQCIFISCKFSYLKIIVSKDNSMYQRCNSRVHIL